MAFFKKLLLLTVSSALIFTLTSCGTSSSVVENSSVPDTEASASAQSSEVSSETPDWKQFLNDYSVWVDKYIKIVEKYNANPSDMSILTDYANIMSEMSEWTAKSEEVQEQLKDVSPKELQEYSAELLKISSKITEAIS